MKVAFRVDSSLGIGSGHIMRCLTLADELRAHGVETLFVCRELKGNLIPFIEKKDHAVRVLSKKSVADTANLTSVPYHLPWLEASLPHDAQETINILKESATELLVVDHYALDYQWHRMVRPYVDKIMVIDDLADRQHDCDVVLDQTYGRSPDEYFPLTPGCNNFLVGSQYALLRPQFAACRSEAMKKRASMKQIERILICFGGMDPHNMSSIALKGLDRLQQKSCLEIDIVLGQMSPHYENVLNLANNSNLPVRVFTYVDDIARLMLEADLAIGAGGTITWERCCLGLPCLAVVAAENQKTIITALDSQGALKNLGWFSFLTETMIFENVTSLLQDHDMCQRMSAEAFLVCDGLGLKRVLNKIFEIWPRP